MVWHLKFQSRPIEIPPQERDLRRRYPLCHYPARQMKSPISLIFIHPWGPPCVLYASLHLCMLLLGMVHVTVNLKFPAPQGTMVRFHVRFAFLNCTEAVHPVWTWTTVAWLFQGRYTEMPTSFRRDTSRPQACLRPKLVPESMGIWGCFYGQGILIGMQVT